MSNANPSLNANGGFPFRDLARRLLAPRLNWHRLIRQSGLPTDIQSLIYRVVKNSRLMRFEKVEVAEELVGHFLDGQIRGQSYAQLAQNFGDPQITATLISRAKIRNRPIMMKLFRMMTWSILGLSGVYLMLMVYFHSGRPDPSINYLADFNRPVLESQPEDHAWPIYRPLWIKYSFSEGGQFHLKEIFHKEHDDQFSRLAEPGDPEWPTAVAKLEELEDLLIAFREGGKKAVMGLALQTDITKYADDDYRALFPHRELRTPAEPWYEVSTSDEETLKLLDEALISILLPHLQSFRKGARLLTVDTRWALEQNDSERAMENMNAIFGIGEQVSDSNTLVGGLVGIAIAHMGFELVEETLQSDPQHLSDEQWAQVQAKIESLSIRDWIRFDGERASMLDIVQRVYTDDGNGDGRITGQGIKLLMSAPWSSNTIPEASNRFLSVASHIAAPASLFVVASRKETTDKLNELLDRHIEDFQKPRWEADLYDSEDFIDENGHRYFVLSHLFPAVASIRTSTDIAISRQEASIAAIAIHRYRMANDAWPTSFDQLTPDFVTEFPLDQLNGDFLKFVNSTDGLVIYSVGTDGDDDLGMPADANQDQVIDEQDYRLILYNQAQDGDWILWPVADSPN